MFQMRPAVAEDTAAVAEVIHARCDWMEQRDIPSWRHAVDSLAGQAEHGHMWLLRSGDDIVGCTTFFDHGPSHSWTEQELAEPALYMFSTITHPKYRGFKPGMLMAYWVVDRAARQGFDWVRRACLDRPLVDYYRDQGFDLVRDFPVKNERLYVMARRAERIRVEELLGTAVG